MTCSADNDQGPYNNIQATNSYLDCMSACGVDSPCVGFTYVGGNNGKGAGTCWLKSEMTTYPSRSSNIISALRVSNATIQAGVSNSTIVLSSSISSSLSSSATSVPPPVTLVTSRDLCPSYNFTTYADNEDNNWQVLCGFDTSPSSYDVIDVSSFAACLEACNSDNECVAVSSFRTACYFKNGYEALTRLKTLTVRLSSTEPIIQYLRGMRYRRDVSAAQLCQLVREPEDRRLSSSLIPLASDARSAFMCLPHTIPIALLH